MNYEKKENILLAITPFWLHLASVKFCFRTRLGLDKVSTKSAQRQNDKMIVEVLKAIMNRNKRKRGKPAACKTPSIGEINNKAFRTHSVGTAQHVALI